MSSQIQWASSKSFFSPLLRLGKHGGLHYRDSNKTMTVMKSWQPSHCDGHIVTKVILSRWPRFHDTLSITVFGWQRSAYPHSTQLIMLLLLTPAIQLWRSLTHLSVALPFACQLTALSTCSPSKSTAELLGTTLVKSEGRQRCQGNFSATRT